VYRARYTAVFAKIVPPGPQVIDTAKHRVYDRHNRGSLPLQSSRTQPVSRQAGLFGLLFGRVFFLWIWVARIVHFFPVSCNFDGCSIIIFDISTINL
jgi:hypothetical protein